MCKIGVSIQMIDDNERKWHQGDSAVIVEIDEDPPLRYLIELVKNETRHYVEYDEFELEDEEE